MSFSQFTVNASASGAMTALAAFAFGPIRLAGRPVDFALTCAFLAGGYTVANFASASFVTVFLALSVAGTLGLVTRMMAPGRTNGDAWREVVFLLAFYFAFQGGVSLLFGDEARKVTGNWTGVIHQFSGARITTIRIAIIACALAIGGLYWGLIQKSGWGRSLRAISMDESLAFGMGVRTRLCTYSACLFGYATAALCGVLACADVGIAPRDGLSLVTNGTIVVIVCGPTNTCLLMICSLLLAFAEQALIVTIGLQWAESVSFVLLIAALLTRAGVAGKMGR